MARNTFKGEGYMTGNDAAYIKPKLVPDYELLGRDDSGGPDYEPYAMQFGDGGFVQGAKAHLSASGGTDDPLEGDEIDQRPNREMDYRAIRKAKEGISQSYGDGAPESSKKMARK